MNNEHLIYLRFTEVIFNSREKCCDVEIGMHETTVLAQSVTMSDMHSNVNFKWNYLNSTSKRIKFLESAIVDALLVTSVDGWPTTLSKRCSSFDLAQLTQFMLSTSYGDTLQNNQVVKNDKKKKCWMLRLRADAWHGRRSGNFECNQILRNATITKQMVVKWMNHILMGLWTQVYLFRKC